MTSRIPVLILTALAIAPAVASAIPAPGAVEVVNEAGGVVSTHTGPDALAAGVATVRTARTDDTRGWSIVAGAGAFGDVLVDEPNLTVRATDGAAVTIAGGGGTDHTGGGCVDIARGGVQLVSLTCANPAGRGIEVRPPAAEGGIVLRSLTVTGSGASGVVVASGAGVLLDAVTVTGAAAGADGVHLTGLTGAGPYRIQGSRFAGNGGDGIDLEGAQRVQIAGTVVESNRENGIEAATATNFDVAIDGVTARANASAGVLLGGGGNRLSLTSSTIAGNTGVGVDVGQLASPVLAGLTFSSANGAGDLRFTATTRTGGSYANLVFGDSPISLAGEPRGVVLAVATASQRRALSPRPRGLVALGRYVRVRDTGAGTSAVTLRFLLTAADIAQTRPSGIRVYEDDPPGNRRRWLVVGGSRFDAVGFAQARLTDAGIASGSDARYATYAPLAPRNGAPAITGVFPANGGTYIGRNVVVSASVQDDGPLGTGSFRLDIDGRRRGGIELRGGGPVWPLLRLPLGTHTAKVTVVDAGGRSAERSWSFTVVNFTPEVKRALSFPRPRARVRSSGTIRVSIRVRDDQPLVRERARVRVDGRTVRVRVVGRRLVGSVFLRPGPHRIQVIYTDLDGAQVRRGWTFRVRR